MKKSKKWLATALIVLSSSQIVWAEVESSFQEALQAAEQGDPEAEFDLGMMYSDGKVVSQDYAQAVKWFRRAAEQRVSEAQFNLGTMYIKVKAYAKIMNRRSSGIVEQRNRVMTKPKLH